MELSISLPAEIAPIADPSARGAAPLLVPRDTGGNTQAAVLPFELCLELLAEPSLGGEVWPADGKDLPLPLPQDGAAFQVPVLLQPLSVVPADALLSATPPTASTTESAEALPSAALPLPGAKAPALPLVTTSELPATPTASPFAPELESIVAPTTGAEAAAIELLPSSEVSAKPLAERSWLEAFFANETRSRAPQPVTTPAADPRTSAPAAAAQAAATAAPTSPAADLLARGSATPAAAQGALRRVDEFRLAAPLSPVVTETSSFGAGDWLPPAGASTGPTSAGAASSVPLPSAPVDVRTPNWQEALAGRMQWLVETQTGEARIKLNPPELGAVDVKISLVDDKTYVQLTTATAAARDELAQSLPRLRELLTVSGLDVGDASVHNGRDQHPTGDGYATRNPASESHPVAAFAEGGVEADLVRTRRSLGRIDVFA